MSSVPEPMRAWYASADELAAWAMERLVNRTDVWGVYGTNPDGSASTWTAPAKGKRGRVLLTQDVLGRHFRACGRRDVIGLHSTSPDNRSRWFAVDVDQHGDDPNRAAVNEGAAIAWWAKLVARGFCPLLTQSNGTGGFHLRGLLADAAETERVFHLVKTLVSDYARYGLHVIPEVFPKQSAIREGGCGNWLRCPGRHHSRDFWSPVWDGERWLHGHDAIDFILSIRPAPISLVPAVPLVPPPRPSVSRSPALSGDALAAQILAYMRRLPTGLGVGEHRDDVAYTFAAFLCRDKALPDLISLAWLSEWDRGNTAPKGPEALAAILENAKKYGKRTVGSGLTDQRTTVVRDRRGHWTITVRG